MPYVKQPAVMESNPRKLKRAYSPVELVVRKFPRLELPGQWKRLIGTPSRFERFYIDGESTSGKSSFVMMLCKVLAGFDRVLYVAREEGMSLSFQQRLVRLRMDEVAGRFQVTMDDTLEDIAVRLRRKRAPHFVVVDSVQYCGVRSFDRFRRVLLDEFPHKSFIWVSQCYRGQPKGKFASDLKFDAGVKLRTEGYRAFCTGRYNDDPSAYMNIWDEGAARYWLREEKL